MSDVNLDHLVKKLSPSSHVALEQALGCVTSHEQRSVELMHWLYYLLEVNDADWQACLGHFNIKKKLLQSELKIRIDRQPSAQGSIPTLSQSVIDTICAAWLFVSLESDLSIISPMFVLVGMLSDPILRQELLTTTEQLRHVDVASLRLWCIDLIKQYPDDLQMDKKRDDTSDVTTALSAYTHDLTKQAKAGQLDPVTGRADEIQQMIDVLLRRKQNNPILIGEPGVGKTACVEGLAQRIIAGTVPACLKQVKLLMLDLTALQAGASIKGEFEKRMQQVVTAVQASSEPIMLFIDEAHQLIGAGGSAGTGDAANILKPALARGTLRTIAATTWQEYKQYIEKDAALVRRFQPITVVEPTPEVALEMLRHVIPKLERHHQISIDTDAVSAAVYLSHRYFSERKLPDKAISLLDTACAKVITPRDGVLPQVIKLEAEIASIDLECLSLQRDHHPKQAVLRALQQRRDKLDKKKSLLQKQQQQEIELIASIKQFDDQSELDATAKAKRRGLIKKLQSVQKQQTMMPYKVSVAMVASILESWTGVPAAAMLARAQCRLLHLEAHCNKHIFGQAKALHMISQRLITSSAKLAKTHKPLGVFLLVGPSGVGKTETAHQLAQQLFGSADKMTTINMSAFKEAHKVAMLTGSPPGYVGYGQGGVLTEAIRREPHSLILLDEMEKAHPSVQDVFYQMLDRGLMRDSEGRVIDCRQTVILMTSNAADQYIKQHAQALMHDENQALEGLQAALGQYFKPAFLGRVNVVPYFPLGAQVLEKVVQHQLQLLQDRMQVHHQIQLVFDHTVIMKIVERSTLALTGARRVQALIDNVLAPRIAEKILTAQARRKRSASKALVIRLVNESFTVDWML